MKKQKKPPSNKDSVLDIIEDVQRGFSDLRNRFAICMIGVTILDAKLLIHPNNAERKKLNLLQIKIAEDMKIMKETMDTAFRKI